MADIAAAAAPPALAVRDLAVAFPARRGAGGGGDPLPLALDGIDLEIAAGEVLGVVGESGAGKSVLGAAVTGLLPPPGRILRGEVRLRGERIDGLPPEAMRRVRGRRIGTVLQDPLASLNPLLTVGRHLLETIRTHLPLGPGEARARAVGLLEEVGLPGARERLEAYPHQLSGGMRQRVAVALALAAEPELVIADEPTTALDVSVQAQVVALLKGLCRRHGAAVMLVTHDMGVIAEAADRVAVLYAGRVAEVGPVRDVIGAPAHPYTAGLMAAIPSLGPGPPPGRLAQIPGAMPRLGAAPPGCPFHPRCPRAFPRCPRERPGLLPAGPTRAACWLHAP